MKRTPYAVLARLVEELDEENERLWNEAEERRQEILRYRQVFANLPHLGAGAVAAIQRALWDLRDGVKDLLPKDEGKTHGKLRN